MLEFELPDGQRVETIGRVVWARTELAAAVAEREGPSKLQPAGVGVEFIRAAADQTATLTKYLANSLPRTRAARSPSAARHTGTPV